MCGHFLRIRAGQEEKKKKNALSTKKVRFKKTDSDQEKRRKEMENPN